MDISLAFYGSSMVAAASFTCARDFFPSFRLLPLILQMKTKKDTFY